MLAHLELWRVRVVRLRRLGGERISFFCRRDLEKENLYISVRFQNEQVQGGYGVLPAVLFPKNDKWVDACLLRQRFSDKAARTLSAEMLESHCWP
jgi:hypothetical protein